MVACPQGLQCNVTCPGNGSTQITGKVYDPAGKNPLYNIAVYVPAVPLVPLPKGVPTGGDSCSCSALFKSGAVVSTATAVDGSFTLTNVPVGSNVPLVLQVGKWRRSVQVNVTACQANAQPDKSLTLPGTLTGAGPDDNMPDIAVSTGGADSLECLMTRIGLPAAEYTAGPGGNGHVHVFSGGNTNALTNPFGGAPMGGLPEANPMPGAPASSTDLWSSQMQLMPFDITLLSCEGDETFNANPAALEQYLNAGGRVFASHFHYAWFAGPLSSKQSYAAPMDWGTNLATWMPDTGRETNGVIGGTIDQTLNGSAMPFAKGAALQQWLQNVNALGQNGVTATDVSIYQPRFNAQVGAGNKPSQPWITADNGSSQTMYFSFDTPVSLNPTTGPSGTSYCGRAVFSDLHVSGDPMTTDTTNSPSLFGLGGGQPPPGGCANVDLSPQEKALEFMLFDLSSCVIPDTIPPSDAGVPQPPPQ
jgi:hypothetical protein